MKRKTKNRKKGGKRSRKKEKKGKRRLVEKGKGPGGAGKVTATGNGV